MPTIGASGFRFARRASALREVGVEAQGTETLVVNAEPTGLDTLAEPSAERGEIEPTGQSKLEVPLASELQSASAEFAQFMRELSEGLTDFKLEKTSDPHGAADVWTDIVKSRSEAFLDNVPDAVRPALRKRVDSLKLFHDFKVRDFERNQTRHNAFASIREARNDYVELVEAEPQKLLFAKEEMDRLLDSSDLSVGAAQSQKAISDLALVRSYVRAGLNGDTPETLLDELKSGRLDALLTDEQKKELIGEVAAALERREREMRMAGQADVEIVAQPKPGRLAPGDRRERTELERLRDSIKPRLVPTAGNPGNIRHIKEKVIDKPVDESDLPLSEKESLKVSLGLEAAWLDGEFELEAGLGRAFLQRVDSGDYDGHFEGNEDAKRKFRDEYEAVLERAEQEAAAARQAKRDAHEAEQDELDAERAHLNDPLVHRWAADQIKADSSDQRPSASQPFLGEGGEHGHEARRRTRQRHWELLARHHRELAEHLPYLSAAWRQAQLSSPEEIEQILGDVRQRLGEDSVLLSGFKLLLKGRTQRLQHDPLQYALENSARLRELVRAADEETEPSMRAALRQTAIAFGKEEQARLTGSTEETRVLSLEHVAKEIGDLEGLTVTQQFDQLRAFLQERNWSRFGRQALGELLDGGLPPLLGATVFLSLTGREDASGYLRRTLEISGVEKWHLLDWQQLSEDEHFAIVRTLRVETADIQRVLATNGLERDAALRLEAAHFVAWAILQDETWVPGKEAPSGAHKRGPIRAEAAARWAIEQLFPFRTFDGAGSWSKSLFGNIPFLDRLHAVLPESFAGGQLPELVYLRMWQRQNNVNKDNISLAVANLIEDVGADQTQDHLREQYAEHVRLYGRWVNIRDGYQLVDQGGHPIAEKDGSPIIERWDEIPEASSPFDAFLVGSSGRTQSDSSFIFGSDLAREIQPGGPQSLKALAAPPGQAFMARVELSRREFMSTSGLDQLILAYHNLPDWTVKRRADGRLEVFLNWPRRIQPEDVRNYCGRDIVVDQSVPEGYVDHLCAQQSRLDLLHSRSVRADSELVDTLSLPFEAIRNEGGALDIVVSKGRRPGSKRRRSKERGERQESATERIATAIAESTKDAFLTELILQTDAMTSPGVVHDPFSRAFFNSILTGALLDLIGLSPNSRSEPSVGRGNVGGG